MMHGRYLVALTLAGLVPGLAVAQGFGGGGGSMGGFGKLSGGFGTQVSGTTSLGGFNFTNSISGSSAVDRSQLVPRPGGGGGLMAGFGGVSFTAPGNFGIPSRPVGFAGGAFPVSGGGGMGGFSGGTMGQAGMGMNGMGGFGGGGMTGMGMGMGMMRMNGGMGFGGRRMGTPGAGIAGMGGMIGLSR